MWGRYKRMSRGMGFLAPWPGAHFWRGDLSGPWPPPPLPVKQIIFLFGIENKTKNKKLCIYSSNLKVNFTFNNLFFRNSMKMMVNQLLH